MQRESDQVARAGCLPFAYWGLARYADADAAVKLLIDKYADLSSYNIAQALAYQGKTDSAFEWLERAYRQRDLGLTIDQGRLLSSWPARGSSIRRLAREDEAGRNSRPMSLALNEWLPPDAVNILLVLFPVVPDRA